jgi:hypothetical protein
MESKIGEVTFGYSEQENHAFIQSLDILKMSSILDYPIAQDYSKHFKLSLENDLGQTTTDLKPTVEFGLGYGAYGRDIAVYALPKVGFRYHDTGNLYLAPEIGAIAQINDTIKVMTSYEYFLNSRYNNRGYNGKFEAFTGYKLSTDVDVYATYARYTDAAQQEDFSLGIAYKF